MQILWITDPWDRLHHRTDGTLRLAQACHRLGIQSYWADVRSIFARSGAPTQVVARAFLEFGRDREAIQLGPERQLPVASFQTVVYRTDPPVNQYYRFPLQLLRTEAEQNPELRILNPPDVLLADSEKLLGFFDPDFFPESLISSQPDPLREFGRRNGRTVMKPLNDARARGVELLEWETPAQIDASTETLRIASDGFRIPVELQVYLPSIRTQGETRLWFSNATLVATARKIPLEGEFKFCSLEGGRVEAHSLDLREQGMAERIAKILRRKQISMAAVDLLEGKVTDFNFTSPGLIVDMERVLGIDFAEKIVQDILNTSR